MDSGETEEDQPDKIGGITDAKATLEPPEVLPADWIIPRAFAYLFALLIMLMIYAIKVSSFRGDQSLNETIAATGILISALTLEFVAFQIDLVMQMAKTQNTLIKRQTDIALRELDIVDRQTAIIERQDLEMRRKPKLALQFANVSDPQSYTIATRPELANPEHLIDIRFAIANTGSIAEGAIIDLFLPGGVRIVEGPPPTIAWQGRERQYKGEELITQRYRARLEQLRLPPGEPVELELTRFSVDWKSVPATTPSSSFPAPYLIGYRIISGGQRHPNEGPGTLRVLPMTVVGSPYGPSTER